jgi:ubiquinone/menaquinone biosynthesis C-methylase UbiE
MESFETEDAAHFTFESFAAHPFYTAINRSLVQQTLALPASRFGSVPLRIVDLACGTGAITRLIVEELPGFPCSARIIAVDPSTEALRRAQKQMEQSTIPVEFVRGEAADLPRLVSPADVVFFCNAIHLLSDKAATFRDIAALLAPGGLFACNSAFYEGTSTDETLRFSRLWIRRAVGWLRQKHPEVLFAREAKPIALQWLTPEGYEHLLHASGFGRVEITQERVMMSLDGLRDLGQYELFIQGALPGVPLAWGAAALGTAVYQAGKELEMAAVPRLWLQMIATKGEWSAP